MSKNRLEILHKKMKANKWQDRETFVSISRNDLEDFVANLKKEFDVHLTSISSLEFSEHFDLYYHFIIYNLPLNVIVKLKKGSSLPSLIALLKYASIYENELTQMWEEQKTNAEN